MADEVNKGPDSAEWDRPSDPDLDFPLREMVEDAFGVERSFLITYQASGINFRVTAEEEDRGGLGYRFTAYSEASPYYALGPLRERMYRSLATRHVTKRGSGYRMLHDTLRGWITTDAAGEVVVVVDGIPLTMEDLREILAGHEGFQVRLEIADPGSDLSR
jgi:hypothetical protein